MNTDSSSIMSAIFPDPSKIRSGISTADVRNGLLLLKAVLIDRGLQTLDLKSSGLSASVFQHLCELAEAASKEGLCEIASSGKDESLNYQIMVFGQVLTPAGLQLIEYAEAYGPPAHRDLVFGYLTGGAFFQEAAPNRPNNTAD